MPYDMECNNYIDFRKQRNGRRFLNEKILVRRKTGKKLRGINLTHMFVLCVVQY